MNESQKSVRDFYIDFYMNVKDHESKELESQKELAMSNQHVNKLSSDTVQDEEDEPKLTILGSVNSESDLNSDDDDIELCDGSSEKVHQKKLDKKNG